MYVVSVDIEKCDGCGECVTICPEGVFRLFDEKADPFQAEDCVFCESCLGVCPAGAITISEI